MRIGIDVDGVLADYMAGIAEAGRDLGHQIEHPGNGPFSYGLVEPGWFPDDDAFTAAMRLMHYDGRLERLALLDVGAPDAVARLRSAGHEIVVVTARNPSAATETCNWLRRNRIHADEVLFERRKAMAGCHVYLDDAPYNIAELREAGASAIVYDTTYNREVEGPRVSDMDAFADLVLSL